MSYYVFELIDEMHGLEGRRNVAARAGEEIALPPWARSAGVLAHYETAVESWRVARQPKGELGWPAAAHSW